MTGSPLLGTFRLIGFIAIILLLAPVQALLLGLRLPLHRRLPSLFHRISCRLIGLNLIRTGAPSTERPTLFVANHSSYLDILVLGALVEGSFVAKSEVAGWPLFGTLARLQETVFIDRKARNAATHRDDIRARLEAGDDLILFPEGTSSDGNRTLPFKTALFSVASVRPRGQALTVQPVSVTATRLDDIPLGRTFRPIYAWYADMELVPHVWDLVRLGRITVEVEFHEPVTVEQFGGSRKALADHCQRVVAAGVDRAVAGRQPPVDFGTQAGVSVFEPQMNTDEHRLMASGG